MNWTVSLMSRRRTCAVVLSCCLTACAAGEKTTTRAAPEPCPAAVPGPVIGDNEAPVPLEWYRDAVAIGTEFACELDRCDLNLEACEDNLSSNASAAAWWEWAQRWGPPLIVGAAAVGLGAGIWLGTELRR